METESWSPPPSAPVQSIVRFICQISNVKPQLATRWQTWCRRGAPPMNASCNYQRSNKLGLFSHWRTPTRLDRHFIDIIHTNRNASLRRMRGCANPTRNFAPIFSLELHFLKFWFLLTRAHCCHPHSTLDKSVMRVQNDFSYCASRKTIAGALPARNRATWSKAWTTATWRADRRGGEMINGKNCILCCLLQSGFSFDIRSHSAP